MGEVYRAEDTKLGHYIICCPVVLQWRSWERETGEVLCRGRPTRGRKQD